MATAVHRLAKLHSMHTSGAAATIVNSAQFRVLLGHVQRLLPYFEVCKPAGFTDTFAMLANCGSSPTARSHRFVSRPAWPVCQPL